MEMKPSQCLRPLNLADLSMLLRWRNHPEVRRYMYSQHEISMAEHSAWFERSSVDPACNLLIFEQNQVPHGFINIRQQGEGRVAEWGFYAAPDAPKGTGKRLGEAALTYAFGDAGLHKLCGRALSFNERSLQFHMSLGFQQEGILRQQHFDGQNYQDVVCFGLLASEWQAKG